MLWTEQDALWPQLTVETGSAVIVRVNVAALKDEPAGEPLMVSVSVPGGRTVVVEIVKEEVAPVVVGSMLPGEKLMVPQGMAPALV